MAVENPNLYVDDPAAYERYISAYLGQGMDEQMARDNLQARGFTLPPEDA